MKKFAKRIFLLISSILILVSCQDKKNNDTMNNKSNKPEVAIERPFLDKTEDSIIIKAQSKATVEKVMKVKEKMTTEAIEAIAGTQNAVQLLSKNDAVHAKNELKKVIGQIKIVINKFPKLNLVPIDVSVNTNNLITDISTVKKITKDAEKALKNENLQVARNLLSGLSSEIRITTTSIPLLTYPKTIKKAIKLIDKNKLKSAKALLVTTLDELVTEEEVIPIPILKAEVMLDEAKERYLEDRSQNKTVVINLLDNTKYQLKLAEALGYGKENKIIYKELNKDIKNLENSVNSKSESKDLFVKLKSKLEKFKKKVF